MISNSTAAFMSQSLLYKALMLSSPLIVSTLLVGLVISIFQAVTQIQDATISTVPKLLIAIIVLVISSNWMLHHLTTYATLTISHIPEVVKQ